ncbi:hypothetical protein EV363DRAFT_1328081 [Boletus edulis]|nr:hypothetical protein EV363DRAFT_1328081 [Boletus edulis]
MTLQGSLRVLTGIFFKLFPSSSSIGLGQAVHRWQSQLQDHGTHCHTAGGGGTNTAPFTPTCTTRAYDQSPRCNRNPKVKDERIHDYFHSHFHFLARVATLQRSVENRLAFRRANVCSMKLSLPLLLLNAVAPLTIYLESQSQKITLMFTLSLLLALRVPISFEIQK